VFVFWYDKGFSVYKPDNSATLIMVVDDEWLNRELMDAILTSYGYSVALVSGGEQALELAPQNKPALILLDVRLPDMSGYEVCKKLKENDITKEIPIILTTALQIETQEKAQMEKCGASDIINRNLPFDEFIGKIKALISPKSVDDEDPT
jgi:CheY-like chemotaxis protein